MLPIVARPRPAGLRARANHSLHTLRMDRNAYRYDNDTGQPDAYQPDAYQLRLGAQDGGERLADVFHLLHLRVPRKAVGALQGRS